MRTAILAGALLVLGVAPAWAQTDPPTLTGRVVQAGRCPVPLGATDDACPDRPVQTTVVIQTPDGQALTSVPTEDDGTFSVALPAGEYQVEPLLADGNPPPTGAIVVDVPAEVLTIRISGGSATLE